MAKLVFAPAAERDLREILDYIAEHNPVAALKYVNDLESVCRNVLARYPHVGRNNHDLPKDFLLFPFRSHVIIYEAVDEAVHVLRIVHGARDLRNLKV